MNSPRWNPGQKAAIEIEGRDLMVTAGAGTGKTTVLVARILRSLHERDFDLNDFLVVTFTDKAAREMKERIYTEIARQPALRHHLPQIPRAQISTIHGFCAGLLRENFLLAGVEPSFRVLDESGQIEALEEALRKTLHEWYLLDDEKGERFRRLVELAGFNENGEELREIVRRLYEYARSTPEFETYLEQILSSGSSSRDPRIDSLPWWPDFLRIAEREWSEAVELYRVFNTEAQNKSYKVTDQLELARLLGEFDPRRLSDPKAVEVWRQSLEAAGRLPAGEPPKLDFPRAPGGANGGVSGYKAAMEEAKKVFNMFLPQFLTFRLEDVLREQRDQALDLHILVSLVREMEGYYSAYKRQGGWLDYGDLEVKAAHFVRSHGKDLGLESRYREVMIDEYQDTNHLQESILRGVSQAGRRFRVGDVKQSIYQFRLADPRIFLEAVRSSRPVRSLEELPGESGEATGRLVPGPASSVADPVAVFLTENYRSHPQILHFVNHLFSWLFDSSTIGSDYAQQALEPGLVPSDEGAGPEAPRVELNLIHLTTKAEENRLLQRFIDAADLQPRWVARRLATLADDPILQRDDGHTDWSGVAILLRSRVRANLFVEALRREGIPANLADGSTLFEEPLLRDLRSILQVVDNPRQDVALAAALRSPVYAITDGDLLRIRMAWPGAIGFLDGLVGAAFSDDPQSALGTYLPNWPSRREAYQHWVGTPHPDHKRLVGAKLRSRIQRALRDFQIWRDRESRMGLTEFLRELAEDVHLVARVAASGESRHPERVLDRVLSLASSFENERGPSLHGFLTRLDALEDSGRLEGGSLEPNQRGVQVMTIHKSKGLEFPVVVVPQLEWRFSSKNRLGGRIRIGPRWVGVRQFDEASSSRREANGRKVLEWIQEEEAREEEARILYVALTRARDRLLLFATDRFDPGHADELPLLLRERRKRTAFDRMRWFKEGIPWDGGQECEPDALRRQGMDLRDDLSWDELNERDAESGEATLGGAAEAVQGPIEQAREWTMKNPDLAIRWIPRARLVASLSTPNGKDEIDSADAGRRQQGSEIRAALETAFGPSLQTNAVSEKELAPGAGSELATDSEPSTGSELATDPEPRTASELDTNSESRASLEQSTDLPKLPGEVSNPRARAVLEQVLARPVAPPVARIEGLRGKYWVTEFKNAGDARRRFAFEEDGTHFGWPFTPTPQDEEDFDQRVVPGVGATPPESDPAAAGVRYHQVLARLDLGRTSAAQLEAQFEEFACAPWWEGCPRDRVLEQGIADFFAEDIGQQLVAAADVGRVEREVSFSLKWSVAELRRYVPDLDLQPDSRWSVEEWRRELERTWVLLQGRIDCVFATPDGWVVVDWKTDRVEASAAATRAEAYRSQMELYREAVSRLWGSPTKVWVAFLKPGVVVPLPEVVGDGSGG